MLGGACRLPPKARGNREQGELRGTTEWRRRRVPLEPFSHHLSLPPLTPRQRRRLSLTVEPAEEDGAKGGGKADCLAGMGGIVWSSLEEGEERASSPSLLAYCRPPSLCFPTFVRRGRYISLSTFLRSVGLSSSSSEKGCLSGSERWGVRQRRKSEGGGLLQDRRVSEKVNRVSCRIDLGPRKI